MLVTVLAAYVAGALLFGMLTLQDTVSTHMFDSAGFAWTLSIGIVFMGAYMLEASVTLLQSVLACAWAGAWLGVAFFRRDDPLHLPFTALFVVVALGWIAASAPLRTAVLWAVAVVVPGAVWVALFALDRAGAWLPQYIAFLVYAGFWWYNMEYDIYDDKSKYVYSAESGAGHWDLRLGRIPQDHVELEGLRATPARV